MGLYSCYNEKRSNRIQGGIASDFCPSLFEGIQKKGGEANDDYISSINVIVFIWEFSHSFAFVYKYKAKKIAYPVMRTG